VLQQKYIDVEYDVLDNPVETLTAIDGVELIEDCEGNCQEVSKCDCCMNSQYSDITMDYFLFKPTEAAFVEHFASRWYPADPCVCNPIVVAFRKDHRTIKNIKELFEKAWGE